MCQEMRTFQALDHAFCTSTKGHFVVYHLPQNSCGIALYVCSLLVRFFCVWLLLLLFALVGAFFSVLCFFFFLYERGRNDAQMSCTLIVQEK